MTQPSPRNHLGPLILAEGVTRTHALSYLLLALCLSGLVGFVSAIQPYIFNEIMGIARDQQGRLTGQLSSIQQAITLVFVTLFGALVDRHGRRPFLLAGAIIITAIVFALPYATTIAHLVLLRIIMGLGTTAYATGGATMMMDLPDNGSRGKFHMLFTYVQMLSTVFLVGFVGMRLPTWLKAADLPDAIVQQLTFSIMGIAGLVATALALFAVRRDVRRTTDRPGFVESWRGFRAVIAHAGTNRNFRVLLITSFATRADGAVLQSFLVLWIVNAGHDQGLSTEQAMILFGNLQIVLTILHVTLPPLMGWLADRMDRAVMLLTSLFLTSVGFCGVLLVDDITSKMLIAVMAVITLVESMQNTAVQTLMGQEAPAALRGSAYGLLNFCGTSTVVLISLVAGYLYDRLGYTAPFLGIAIFSLVFALIATVAYRRSATAIVPS